MSRNYEIQKPRGAAAPLSCQSGSCCMKQEPQRCDAVRTARGVASKISPAKSQTNEIPLRVKQKQLVWYFWVFCGTAVKSFLRRASAVAFINVLFFMLVLERLFNSCKYECRYFVTFLLFLIFVFSQQKVKKQRKIFCICRTVWRDSVLVV